MGILSSIQQVRLPLSLERARPPEGEALRQEKPVSVPFKRGVPPISLRPRRATAGTARVIRSLRRIFTRHRPAATMIRKVFGQGEYNLGGYLGPDISMAEAQNGGRAVRLRRRGPHGPCAGRPRSAYAGAASCATTKRERARRSTSVDGKAAASRRTPKGLGYGYFGA